MYELTMSTIQKIMRGDDIEIPNTVTVGGYIFEKSSIQRAINEAKEKGWKAFQVRKRLIEAQHADESFFPKHDLSKRGHYQSQSATPKYKNTKPISIEDISWKV